MSCFQQISEQPSSISERWMYGFALVTPAQASVLRQPGGRALDDSAVYAEPRFGLNADGRDAVLVVPGAAGASAPRVVVAVVGVQLYGPAP